MSTEHNLPPIRRSLPRIALRIAVVAAAVWAAHQLMNWVVGAAEHYSSTGGQGIMIGVLAVLLLAYALLIAIPFVPGIEIGISLLVLRGAEIAPYVYLCTVAGLMIAFFAGRFLSYDWLRRIFADLRLRGACALLDDLKPLSRHERLRLLRERLPGWAAPLAIPGRYAVLVLLLNLPGNALIGGGGGISLVAGLSRLFSTRAAFATIALAVLPVPLAIWLFGVELADRFL